VSVSFEYPLAVMRKDAGESDPRNVTSGLLKEQHHNVLNDSKTASRLPNSYS